jgi:AraC-like DNA-binding protein
VASDSGAYVDYRDFYQAQYGAYITRSAVLGPITLVEASQSAGDFSDKATGDLTLIRPLSRHRVHADFSSGLFTSWGTRGDFALNPAGFANSIVVDQAHRIDAVALSWTKLRDEDQENILPSDGDFGAAHAGAIRDPEMYALFDRLWQIEGSDAATLEAETAALWITRRLLEWSGRPRRSPAPEKLSARSLKLATERMDAPGATAATLTELAGLCRLSSYHFCRAFKAATGLPPHRWQVVRRIGRARELLTGTALPIGEVGAAVGYDDAAYFSRLFARETGLSPSAWRRERLS